MLPWPKWHGGEQIQLWPNSSPEMLKKVEHGVRDDNPNPSLDTATLTLTITLTLSLITGTFMRETPRWQAQRAFFGLSRIAL